MKFAVDGRGAILYRGTGIGTYTWQLIAHLQELEPALRVFWPGEEYRDFSLASPQALLLAEGGDGWREHFLPRVLRNEGIELYHVPQNGLGLPARKQCRQIVTIHDLIPYLFPETVGRGYLKEFLSEMPRVLEQSDRVIAVSECTKRDICRIFDYPAAQIDVIAEAPEPFYRPPVPDTSPLPRTAYGVTKPYIFYAGGFGQRKNVKALINAFALLCREQNLPQDLVIAGRRQKEHDESEALAAALGIGDRVIFPGYLPVADMAEFYGRADLFVYPSFYEGFGLPPLEAMACGCPVLAARSSSLPEVLGDAAAYCDPLDTVDIAAQMAHILSDGDLRAGLRTRGLQRAAAFSWREAARQTLQSYVRAVKEAL